MKRISLSRPAAFLAAMLTATSVGLISTATMATAEPAHSPSVSDKAAAPATDLTHYPKRAVAPADPARWGAPRTGNEVVASSVRTDGSHSTTYYTPVRGESAATLYKLLKNKGITGLQDPGTAAPAAAPAPAGASSTMLAAGITSCRYGTAQLFNCATDSNVAHQNHWTNGCCTDPQIWFVDHTGASWPVNASTSVWNQTPGIDSHYVYGSCPNYSGQHCVNVTDRDAGCTGWEGQTTVGRDVNYNIVSASIEMNDYNGKCTVNGVTYDYNKDSNGYRKAICHEQGHALGMGHNSSSTTSCMYATNINSSTLLQPNSDDTTLLSQLYSVTY